LILAASASYAEPEVQAVVQLFDISDGTTRFVYINDERLLVVDYRHDPSEAFWKEIPDWSERALTAAQVDEFVSNVSGIVTGWDSEYSGLVEGEKRCLDFAWGVKINSPKLIFDSSGICKEPENFSDLIAEVTSLIAENQQN